VTKKRSKGVKISYSENCQKFPDDLMGHDYTTVFGRGQANSSKSVIK